MAMRATYHAKQVAVKTRQPEPWDGLLEAGRADERLVREAAEHERPPVLEGMPPLHPLLVDALRAQGIEELFAHQVDAVGAAMEGRSEEHTSELQSRQYLVCRLLLEKKKKIQTNKFRR